MNSGIAIAIRDSAAVMNKVTLHATTQLTAPRMTLPTQIGLTCAALTHLLKRPIHSSNSALATLTKIAVLQELSKKSKPRMVILFIKLEKMLTRTSTVITNAHATPKLNAVKETLTITTENTAHVTAASTAARRAHLTRWSNHGS